MKTIKHTNIQPKSRTFQGTHYEYENTQGTFNAEVVPKQSIRIFGTFTNRIEPINFDKTFRVEDEVIHGSYNLIYTGEIVAIGPKTVTVNDYGRAVRLDLYEFINYNFDLDLGRIKESNADTMMHI